MNNAIFGAHMSVAKGFVEAAERASDEYGASALQVFMKSPRGRGKTKLTPEIGEQFRAYTADRGIDFVMAHGSYLVNLSKPMDHEEPWSIISLADDLQTVDWLGGKGVVLHTGKKKDLPYEEAEKYLVDNLKRTLARVPDSETHILLENMAGQGTEIGVTFEELASIHQKVDRHPRISICFDTCHAFAAGYDLRTPEAVKETLAHFDKTVGLDYLTVFHFNDSMHPLDSRKDRHHVLGEGEIGSRGLKYLAEWAADRGVPMVLETPEKIRSHKEDIDILRGWLS